MTQFIQHELGDYECAFDDAGLANVEYPSVDDYAGVEQLWTRRLVVFVVVLIPSEKT